MPVGTDSLRRTAKSVSTPNKAQTEKKADDVEVKMDSSKTEKAATTAKKTVKTTSKTASTTKKTAAKNAKTKETDTLSEKSTSKDETGLKAKGILKKDVAKSIAQAAKTRAAKEEITSGIKCELPTYLL